MEGPLRIAVIVAGLGVVVCPQPAHAQRPSTAIATENARPGTTDWLVTRSEAVGVNARDDRYQRQRTIEGYVSHTSIRAGETLTAFVSTNPAAPYRAEVYRMGWYGGTGGRLMTSVATRQGIVQAEPVEGGKQLMEARWQPSFRIPIPATWLSERVSGEADE